VTALVLWDIDGPLLTIEDLSVEIYAAAFQEVTGRELERMPPMAGRTDHDLIAAVLTTHGIEISDQVLADSCLALASATRARRHDMKHKGRALPGAIAALVAIGSVSGVAQSVVTGNVRAIAEEKLSLFGMERYLDIEVGGYGSDDSHRAKLVRLACDRAEHKYGSVFGPGNAVVIGDTTHDIAGARDNGLAAVGVASGGTPAEVLAAAGADAVMPTLTDTAAVVRVVLGQVRPTGSAGRR
jgi:phosphoglycolate phosphatase-like HAD superfamily hydrolase